MVPSIFIQAEEIKASYQLSQITTFKDKFMSYAQLLQTLSI